ncbi:unnamed protein product [Effrenium voratum]|nr:unnamed protein product [Effrenium voratum]
MARLTSLVLVAACVLLGSRLSTLLFASAPSQQLRSRVITRAVDERDEGLVLITPEESGKVVKRDVNNNPPRIVMKTNDWDQPEIQLSTGASNQINYITPVVASDDIKAWLSLNVNFFSILALLTVGGIIEIQRFFPDTLYWCVFVGSRVASSLGYHLDDFDKIWLLFVNSPAQNLRSSVAARAVDERDEGLVLITPEESGKVVKRDVNNNPPRIVMKTNDWDQPEIQLSTGASNQINYITPVVASDDIKAWLSLNVNFFSILALLTVGGIIEIQRFFPDTLYW